MDSCIGAGLGLLALYVIFHIFKSLFKTATLQIILTVIILIMIAAFLQGLSSGGRSGPSDRAAASSSCSGTWKTISASNGVRIRSGPSTDYAKLGGLSNGANVCVIDDSNGWSLIDTDGTDAEGSAGYVSSKFLE